MPKVNGKRYPYTPKGILAAKKAAKRTGVPLKMSDEAMEYHTNRGGRGTNALSALKKTMGGRWG